MKTISRDKLKKRGFGRFLKSFIYSIEGLVYAYKHEQSVLIHFVATAIAVFLGMFFGIEAIEWLIIILSFAIILIVELFNTAIEAVVDMVTLDMHPLAKIAKDCGSAATFVVSAITFAICMAIFAPYFITVFS